MRRIEPIAYFSFVVIVFKFMNKAFNDEYGSFPHKPNLHSFEIPKQTEEEQNQIKSGCPFYKGSDIYPFHAVSYCQQYKANHNKICVFFYLIAPFWTELLNNPQFPVNIWCSDDDKQADQEKGGSSCNMSSPVHISPIRHCGCWNAQRNTAEDRKIAKTVDSRFRDTHDFKAGYLQVISWLWMVYLRSWKVMTKTGAATISPILNGIYSGYLIPVWVISVQGKGLTSCCLSAMWYERPMAKVATKEPIMGKTEPLKPTMWGFADSSSSSTAGWYASSKDGYIGLFMTLQINMDNFFIIIINGGSGSRCFWPAEAPICPHSPTIFIYCKIVLRGWLPYSQSLDPLQSRQPGKLIGRIHNKCILSYLCRILLFFLNHLVEVHFQL